MANTPYIQKGVQRVGSHIENVDIAWTYINSIIKNVTAGLQTVTSNVRSHSVTSNDVGCHILRVCLSVMKHSEDEFVQNLHQYDARSSVAHRM